ncbi:N-6 DNA methylase [Streptomyces calvus]|uniref:site-specific DNA-methyltransferase (adenine-specific) n=1 Tax=Streptomyces calvus TaxID=67282 RepID=A0A514JRX1_9ACTN|nr:N-6 DNA methylase [Streptomyces calvus]QDI70103.1 N-6 DNA methylase [Streptomyces calvus]
MPKTTLAELERHLLKAADILRGAMDVSEYRDLILSLLFLKRANDEFERNREAILAEAPATGCSVEAARGMAEAPQNYIDRGAVYVPEPARWARLAGAVDDIGPGHLEPALTALTSHEANEHLRGLYPYGTFRHTGGIGASADRQLAGLISYFGRLQLGTGDLESPDLIGTAYEFLLQTYADAAGMRGGEFYTPRAVARMLARLARPAPEQRVYDPCMGSGGMLLHAKEYVDEHGGDSSGLTLDGQDANHGSWTMATLNMLFHGHRRFRLEVGDTLTSPRHAGESYDLVLSNPPFAMHYSAAHVADSAERMPYGVTSERGRADLMFLQHMLYMVRDRGGSVFTVMPHGVLFRGGAERSVREHLIRNDLLEAVIGLAPNLFHGTGIPACVLVLRAQGRKAPERRGKVLFINAEREYHSGRVQNVLLDEHVEKIVATFHDFAETDRFSRVVSLTELAESDHNLSVRRYVDSAPPPEPQDIKAYLQGGVPVAEIETNRALLEAYGLKASDLFVVRPDDPAYVDFPPERERPDGVRLAEMVRGREQQLRDAFEEWWSGAADRITQVTPPEAGERPERVSGQRLSLLRADLVDSFRTSLSAVGLLDRLELMGAASAWWRALKSDLKALAANGAVGVVDGWVRLVEATLTGGTDPLSDQPLATAKAERKQAYEREVVGVLLPDFLHELHAAEAELTGLTAQLQEAQAVLDQTRARAETQGEESDGEDDSTADEAAAAATVRELRRRRTSARKVITSLEGDFLPRLSNARDASASEPAAREIVLGTFKKRVTDGLEELLTRRRLELVRVYERWQEKYLLSFREIEAQLYGHGDGVAQNNPWSARRTWNLTSRAAGTAAGRRELLAAVHELIDAEKAAEGALAKLDLDEMAGTLALIRGGADRVARRPLGEVLTHARGGGSHRARPGAVGAPVIRMANITADGLDLDPSRLHRLDAGGPVGADALLRAGDVLLAAVAPDRKLRVAVWRGQLARATFSAQVVCLRPGEELLSTDYLWAWLRLPHVQRRIFDVARTMTGDTPVLSPGRLVDVEMELPGIMDQRELGRRIGAWHEQRVARGRQLAKLRVIRQALTKVLSG